MKIWDDITKNQQTGHYVTLDLMKAVCFIVGIQLTVFAAVAKFTLLALVIYADYSQRFINIDVPLAPGLILISFGFGMQGQKLIKSYLERKTMDGNGNPLFTAATAEYAPPAQPIPSTETAGTTADAPLPSE